MGTYYEVMDKNNNIFFIDKEDKEIVQKAFAELIQNGIYAEKLWE